MIGAYLLAKLGPLETLHDRLSRIMAPHHITGLDICLCGLTGLLVLWICAIARTSIRDASRSRRVY
jgi:hypothetical protein